MSTEPTAFSILREGLARILDAVGVVLLAWLGIQVLLGGSHPFEREALWVGGIGALACLLVPGSARNVPLPMLAVVAIALISSVAPRSQEIVPEPQLGWVAELAPAAHLVTMTIVVFGVAFLLRTPRRLCMLSVLLVTSISVLAVQILFDRAIWNFVYVREGSIALPDVAQWGGLHQTGMLLVVALPFPVAHILSKGPVWQKAAGIVMAAAFLVVALVNGSTGGIIAMAFVGAAMTAAVTVAGRRRDGLRVMIGGGIMLMAAVFLFAVSTGRIPFVYHGDVAGRLPIWRAAAAIARDYFWLGVGPGHYSTAMVNGGYAARYLPGEGGIEQAHNMLLHVAAELGVPGALCFLALWLWMFRSCWQARARGPVPMVALGLLFALAGFFIRSMSDSFLDGLVTIDRTRVLVWILFGAALALDRISRLPLAATPPAHNLGRATFALAGALLVAVEVGTVFFDRADTFKISGSQAYDVTEFSEGRTVAHAFLMRGDGLHSVELRFSSTAATTAQVQWTLWRGHPDRRSEMTRAFEGVESFDLRPGRQWKSVTFPRDGSSHDRWYTIELRMVDVRPAPAPQVSVVASRDNPDRGGVLWVNLIRQPGSLFLRAERRGRTLYRRFLIEAAPNLPAGLRIPAVQWGIAIAFQIALGMFAYATLSERRRTSHRAE